MKNKSKAIAALALSCSLMAVSSASAFSDVKGQDSEVIKSLQSKKIIQGITKDKFAPQGKLTAAQGIHLVVKALQLKSDSSAQLDKGAAWYAESLKIAKANGIPVDLAATPSTELTKEQFAHILYKGIRATGEYPLIKMYIQVADDSETTPDYQGSIQNLLLMKIASLDSSQKFHPKDKITRMEAALMVYKAAEFVDNHKAAQNEAQQVSFSIEKVNDQINRVVLTRAQQPNPGYGISIEKVDFTAEGTAVIYYKLESPDPDKMYPQVITDTKTETYLSSKYNVEIALSK
ncbi:protease complex subunit PrcB family protein [Paenibacillus zeisoli]|uniref:Protease complex subunit PrcB family protein n=1 Tax=Paenibacillus zeisoli TaxID=2496267 RepID=A0A3S1D4V1_9BACL|nr:S-layer homology domain-containing protein [Paenibacillus zeisoli]RUT29808.1 protease complex subunit PrcB family protein [Paenibacillus zeisoli]